MAYFGIDLHSNNFAVCRMNEDGTTALGSFRTDPASMDAFRKALSKDDGIAVEATTSTAWFRDQVKERVRRVVAVNPRRFPVICKSVSKTDRNDAKALALFLSKDLLPETRVKSQEASALASLSNARDIMVKQRTSVLNKLHSNHARHGIKLKKEAMASLRRLRGLDFGSFPLNERFEMEKLRDMAIHLSGEIAEFDKKIEEMAREIEGCEGLVSIKGVGARSAAVLLSAIGDVNDFETADKLAACIGIVPRVSQSNATTHHGRIAKHGCKLARTVLVQCSLAAIKYSPYLREFYSRIKARGGHGKAIVATARKLLGIIYDTLRNGWVFDDFPAFQVRGAA